MRNIHIKPSMAMNMLQKTFNRNINHLRLSVTDRCDYHCIYCQPRGLHHNETPQDWLTGEEIERMVAQFASLGVSHVQLAGGEPSMRPDLCEIARRITALPGIDELSLSTNGSRLAQQAAELRRAGVERLNISLDSLNEINYKRITGGRLQSVLAGIESAIEQGFQSIKINMMVMRGVNDYEVDAMIEYCLSQDLGLHLIETSPRRDSDSHENHHYIPMSEVEERIRLRHGLTPTTMHGGPARFMRIDDSELVVGFITSRAQHFNECCNRVRLSVAGDLHPGQGQDDRLALHPLPRKGASNAVLQKAIKQAITHKPELPFDGTSWADIRSMSTLDG